MSWRDERGAVGGIEVLPLGFLVLVVGTLLVVNAWAVVDTKLAASSAAREAVRTYVEAPDARIAVHDAQGAARAALAGYGRDPSLLRLQWHAAPFARCARVQVVATYPVPLVVLPWIGGAGRGFTVRSSHSELVDPYRSGLTGAATCA